MHIGLYPLLDGDRCWWLAADFDGPAAMLDALVYLKAARALQVPAALEVSRSGVGAHAWVFFTGPVPAETARRLGTGLLREAMALRGQMDLASYDRLFPSQDVLPAGGGGEPDRRAVAWPVPRDGATVFLDLATLEPHEDQWAFLSALGRMSPREVARAADKAGRVTVGAEVEPDRRAGLHPDQASTAAGHPRPSRRWHPGGAGRADASLARHVEARGVDAEPAVL